MKNIYKLISLLLAVVMVLSAITALFTVEIFADDSTTTGGETGNGVSVDHLTHYFATPEEKIATMGAPRLEKGDYELYVDTFSGEIALKNTVTNEMLFSKVATRRTLAYRRVELLLH